MSTKREAAHIAARRGFDVFPITPDRKTPLIANWQNLATQDPAQIDAWWTEWPDANIAAATNNLVIDVDPRNGGGDTIGTLLDIEEFPKTDCAARRKAAATISFTRRRTGPVKGGTNKLGKGVDIKARGGYILLPGSTIEGRAYTWQNDSADRAGAGVAVAASATRQTRRRDAASASAIVEEDDAAREMFEQWMLRIARHGRSSARSTTPRTRWRPGVRLRLQRGDRLRDRARSGTRAIATGWATSSACRSWSNQPAVTETSHRHRNTRSHQASKQSRSTRPRRRSTSTVSTHETDRRAQGRKLLRSGRHGAHPRPNRSSRASSTAAPCRSSMANRTPAKPSSPSTWRSTSPRPPLDGQEDAPGGVVYVAAEGGGASTSGWLRSARPIRTSPTCRCSWSSSRSTCLHGPEHAKRVGRGSAGRWQNSRAMCSR
jgi:hypothetical protein